MSPSGLWDQSSNWNPTTGPEPGRLSLPNGGDGSALLHTEWPPHVRSRREASQREGGLGYTAGKSDTPHLRYGQPGRGCARAPFLAAVIFSGDAVSGRHFNGNKQDQCFLELGKHSLDTAFPIPTVCSALRRIGHRRQKQTFKWLHEA